MRKRVPREYQELFCVGELTEMEKRMYGGDPYRERVGGMHYCTKTEKAGDTLVLTVYPILGRSDRAKAEAARKAMSRERQNRYNRERARRRLALLMDANFGRNDLHVTLTYRGTPPDYEQARKDVRNYLRAVKRMREKAGLPEMKYIYVLEEEGGDGEKRRIHVHLMMTGGISREALEEKWGRGYANCDRLQPEEGNGLMELARYFTKLEQEKHRRAWSASKNLRQPRTTVSRTRMSNARVRRLCQEIPGNAAEIMGKLYPAYKLGAVEPYVSDWIPGVYLRIRLRRRCP